MKLALVLLALCAPLAILHAQHATSVEASEGYRFEVAFPRIWPEQSELPIQPSPQLLVISSKTAGTVTIDGHGNNRIIKRLSLRKNGIIHFPIPESYMPAANGESTSLGITLESTVPISVESMSNWQGNKTSVRHLPVRTWGMAYHTFNYFQDAYLAKGLEGVRCGQFMIVADKDATEVTVLSKVALEAGKDVPNGIPANVATTFTLNAHEVINLVAVADTALTHDSASDLTGTVVTASKPIAVISGHAKGGVGKFPKEIPQESRSGHFTRNSMAQVMLPDAVAGMEFVTTPLMYTAKRVKDDNYDMEAPNGNVVRFVATADSTNIYGSAPSPNSPPVLLATIHAGESYTNYWQEESRVWTSSKPVLCMQYGKSWAKRNVFGKGGGKETDSVEGHPHVEVGMPFMMVIPPTARAIHDGGFRSHEGMDNFLNIVFKGDAKSLSVDGKSLMSVFGGAIQTIPNTDWMYVRSPIGVGDHMISVNNSNTTFQAWAYASLDGMEMGGAYGTPVGIGYAPGECNGDIDVRVMPGVPRMVLASAGCAVIGSHSVLAASNAVVDSAAYTDEGMTLYISREEEATQGSITVRFIASNGKARDTTLVLDMSSPVVPPFEARLVATNIVLRKNMPASDGIVSLIATTHLSRNAYNGVLKLKYDSRVVSPSSFQAGVPVPNEEGMKISTISLKPGERSAETKLLQLRFNARTDQHAHSPIQIVDVRWTDTADIPITLHTNIAGTTLWVLPEGTSSVEDDAERNHMTITPMPVQGTATISYDCITLPTTLQVYDMAGALVMDLSSMLAGPQGSVRLDTQPLARGSYSVRMQIGAGAVVTRLVVE